MLIRRGDSASAASDFPSGTLRILAPAKINLFFEAISRRADGFHEIATLMLAIDLCDTVEFALPQAGEESSSIGLTCDDPRLDTGPGNLIRKAAELLKAETGVSNGARIGLKKVIPWAAGLGGGSSDAAATLIGLSELWDLKLSRAELATIGAKLGSDVPFFVQIERSPAAWCTGRGEIIEPIDAPRAFDFVLVKPEVGLSTRDVYGRLKVPERPNVGQDVRRAVETGDVDGLARSMFNRLEEPALEIEPVVAEWRRRLSRTPGVLASLMSGSGSCSFALCRSTPEARQVLDDLSGGTTSGGLPGSRMHQVRSFLCDATPV